MKIKLLKDGKWYLYDQAKGTLTPIGEDGKASGDPQDVGKLDSSEYELEGGDDRYLSHLRDVRSEAANLRQRFKERDDELKKVLAALGDIKPDTVKDLAEKAAMVPKLQEQIKTTNAKGDEAVKKLLDEARAEEQAKTRLTQEKLDLLNGKYRTLRVDAHLASVAKELDAINPDHVAALTRSNVKLDEETDLLVVMDQEGKPKLSSKDGNRMSTREFVEEFMKGNPNFVRGSSRGGGSGGDGHGSGKAFKDMTAAEKITAGLNAQQ